GVDDDRGTTPRMNWVDQTLRPLLQTRKSSNSSFGLSPINSSPNARVVRQQASQNGRETVFAGLALYDSLPCSWYTAVPSAKHVSLRKIQ
ncbi:MAG: hypothetical protein ACR2O2_08910, partial [Ruegeria sp.]